MSITPSKLLEMGYSRNLGEGGITTFSRGINPYTSLRFTTQSEREGIVATIQFTSKECITVNIELGSHHTVRAIESRAEQMFVCVYPTYTYDCYAMIYRTCGGYVIAHNRSVRVVELSESRFHENLKLLADLMVKLPELSASLNYESLLNENLLYEIQGVRESLLLTLPLHPYRDYDFKGVQ